MIYFLAYCDIEDVLLSEIQIELGILNAIRQPSLQSLINAFCFSIQYPIQLLRFWGPRLSSKCKSGMLGMKEETQEEGMLGTWTLGPLGYSQYMGCGGTWALPFWLSGEDK